MIYQKSEISSLQFTKHCLANTFRFSIFPPSAWTGSRCLLVILTCQLRRLSPSITLHFIHPTENLAVHTTQTNIQKVFTFKQWYWVSVQIISNPNNFLTKILRPIFKPNVKSKSWNIKNYQTLIRFWTKFLWTEWPKINAIQVQKVRANLSEFQLLRGLTERVFHG